MFAFLQIPFLSVQCVGAVLPYCASSPAAGTVPPPGPLPPAGGPESGGGGRAGLQLEGGTHDASIPAMRSRLSLINKSSPDPLQAHTGVMGVTR